MREFNTFGPVNPRQHYHVNRVAVKADLRAKIDKGRYLTLNAARQTGKTTLFREVVAEMEATGDYFAILLDFGALRGFSGTRLYERLTVDLNGQAVRLGLPTPAPQRDHGDFLDWLRLCVAQRGQRGVLIIDEFDAVQEDILTNLLSLLRAMYLARYDPLYPALHSIILVGVRALPSLLHGTQSPFNIADSFLLPYFTPAEVVDLLSQHTAETGQPFATDVIEAITRETEGQPFLVNRLGQLLTAEIVPERSRTIVKSDLAYALSLLLSENNTHFASILSKAIPHRAVLLPMLLYGEQMSDFLAAETQDLLMYGVLRGVEDTQHLRFARIACPIYRKLLLMRLARPELDPPVNGSVANRYVTGGVLDFDRLLESFQAFMAEHGVRLLRSAASGRPLEISGQYLLLSYLSAVLSSVGGLVTIESVSAAGEVDLLVFHQARRFIIETKIWQGLAAYVQGQAQLAAYVTAAGLEKGHLVVFDEQLAANPLLGEHGPVFEQSVANKQIRTYLVTAA